MDATAIKKLLNQPNPQPFILHLADGRSLEVSHPEFISISKSGRRVIVETQDDSFEIIDTIMIVSIEVRPPSKLAA
jgi:hypothetical protein